MTGRLDGLVVNFEMLAYEGLGSSPWAAERD